MAQDVRCSGCGRKLAVTPNKLPGYIYDDLPEIGLLCAAEPSAGKNEERDAIIVELANRLPVQQVAEIADITRQRVQQIVAAW